MGFTDAPGQKARRVPRGIAPLADVVPGAEVVKTSRRRGEKRRNAVAPAVGKNVDNVPSASQKRRRKRVQS